MTNTNTHSNTTTTDAAAIDPISKREAPGLAEEEYRRWAVAIADLKPADWDRSTDCELWTVRDMAGHVLGAMRAAASIREQLSQQREIGKRHKATGENEVQIMTALQIERTADLSAAELVAETRSLVGPAAKGRRRTPAPMRRLVKIPVDLGSIVETWTLGYLVDTILTRDIFMHRIDLARAIGGSPDLTGTHAARIVQDIVGEWARRHHRPFDVTLVGPAGGRFQVAGNHAEVIEIEALEFCRILSGRGTGDGLLAQQVPF